MSVAFGKAKGWVDKSFDQRFGHCAQNYLENRYAENFRG